MAVSHRATSLQVLSRWRLPLLPEGFGTEASEALTPSALHTPIFCPLPREHLGIFWFFGRLLAVSKVPNTP